MASSPTSAARGWSPRRAALIVLILWTVLLAGSLALNVALERLAVIDLSRTEARSAYNKDLLYRRWASLQGGVYVPITDQTPPNPYLNVPEREIQTPSGRTLTLVNPAYMTRQVHELDVKQSGVHGHITSLNPLRPENTPDVWEALALQEFENGVPEVSAEVALNGAPYLRLMRPMVTEESCLKCHGAQGYQVGDVRGGISVSVPLAPYYVVLNDQILHLAMGYAFIWVLGALGISVVAYFLQKRASAYNQVATALQASEEKFFKAFQFAPLLMTLSSLDDGTYLDVNEKFLQVSGFTRGEVLGRTSMEIGWISAEARQQLVEIMRAQGRVTDLELQLHTKDGRTIICLYQGELLTIKDQPRLLSIAMDITDRKRVEDELRQERDRAQNYLNTVETIIVALNTIGEIVTINRKGCELLGYTEGELLGQNWFIACLPQPAGMAEVYPDFLNLINENVAAMEYYENPVVTRAGAVRQIAWHNTILHDEQGQVSGTLSAGEDVTERNLLEEQIRQQERLAAVGQLAAGIAHDFNNFLTTLMLYAQLGLRYPDRPVNVTRSLETILAESRKAATLVQQILDFSRRSAIEFKTTDLRPLLENVVSVLRHTLPEDINLQLDFVPTVTAFTVKIDPTRFQQIVTNLATNSRDAMPRGGDLRIVLDRVVVPVSSLAAPENVPQGDWVRLEVSDTGPGMPPQVLEHIFEPFFTTKPPGKGTGLGLPQVHGIVAQHGGHIKVETAPTRGTTFYIYFPAVRPNGQTEPLVDERLLPEGRREKILLVEDRDELRLAACELLENQGYLVLTAANGREALRLSQSETDIDLVITDLVMPEMGGRELVHALHTVLPRLKALAITGYVLPEEERSLREDGFLDVIYKPFDMNNLTYLVRRALDTRYS